MLQVDMCISIAYLSCKFKTNRSKRTLNLGSGLKLLRYRKAEERTFPAKT